MAERALSPADFGIGRLFELVPDAVVLAEAGSGQIVLWNGAATDIFGYLETEALGMPIERLVPEELVGRHRAGLARFARGEASSLVDTSAAVELPAIRRDGQTIWVELKLSSVPAEGRVGRYVLAVIREVTARKLAEADAAAHAEALRTANEGLRDFLSMAAHDIVNPAGAITAALEMFSGADPDRQATLLGLVERQAAHITRLGQDLRELSAIEQGAVSTRPERLRVETVVESAIEVASLAVAIDHADVPRDLAWFVDREHAVRILTNYLTNAAKHGRPPIELSAELMPPRVVVRVIDHGDGIAPAFAPRLFDKFSRASGSVEGLGLGLAIVDGLAKANRGNTWYEPVTPHGSMFVVALPAAE